MTDKILNLTKTPFLYHNNHYNFLNKIKKFNPPSHKLWRDKGYEDTGKKMENNNFDEHLETEETASNDLLQATQDQLDQTKKQLVSLGADFQNYKKRAEKDRLLWTQTTRAELLLQLLPIVDDFDRALQGDVNTEGLALIHKLFYDYLKKNGVTPITQHTTFDPELHEAVMQSHVEGKQEGEIIAVLQAGFMCNGTVLRHSKVSVCS